MKYGVARKLYVYNYDKQYGVEIITRPSDFIKGTDFAREHNIDGLFVTDYCWGWFALKRAGLIKQCGLPEELTPEAVNGMLDYVTMVFDGIEDDELPLVLVEQD